MSDYGGFRALAEQVREEEREEREAELVACPICGEPLDENSVGYKNCPLGHFRAPPGATVGTHGSVG